MIKGQKLALLAVAALLGLTACGAMRFYTSRYYADTATVMTPGVSIRATDNSFRLDSGESTRVTQRMKAFRCPLGRGASGKLDAYDWLSAIDSGFRRVLISHPQSDQPLFGLLGFCPIHRNERSINHGYQIQIPSRFVPTTDTEKQVVYEHSSQHLSHGRPIPGFMLFLSRTPFR